jgi:hypothetical protein
MSQDAPSALRGSASKRALGFAIALAFALALFWRVTLPDSPAWGWDESMHAELPAVRMLVALRHFEVGHAFDALLDCSQYPFVWPVCLAAAQAVFGVSEMVARTAGIAVWAAALVGVYLLARELEHALPRERARGWLPWIAFALAALSPLALDYAGTLFLEVPFTCAAVYALLAWVRFSRAPSNRGAYMAGAWITLALFTKFNYGLLLGFGLVLDVLVGAVLHSRSGDVRVFAARMLRVAAIPAIACAWWFVLPLPGGFAVGAEHRSVLVEFLSGNLQMTPTSAARRVLFAATYFAITPRMLIVLLAGFALALRCAKDPAVRALAIVFVASGLPVWIHPFHLDRFQIPSGATFWPLAAFGIASVLSSQGGRRWFALLGIAVLALGFAGSDTLWLAGRLGELQSEPRVLAYQEQIFRARRSLGANRALSTNGLERAEHDAFLDLVAANTKPSEVVGWIGVSQALSPAAVHLGLLARQGNDERFLREATLPIDITYFGQDPGWDDARLLEFAKRFDVIFATDPADARDQADRRFPKAYRERLVASGRWSAVIAGTVDVARPLQPPRRVTLYTCRRSP